MVSCNTNKPGLQTVVNELTNVQKQHCFSAHIRRLPKTAILMEFAIIIPIVLVNSYVCNICIVVDSAE